MQFSDIVKNRQFLQFRGSCFARGACSIVNHMPFARPILSPPRTVCSTSLRCPVLGIFAREHIDVVRLHTAHGFSRFPCYLYGADGHRHWRLLTAHPRSDRPENLIRTITCTIPHAKCQPSTHHRRRAIRKLIMTKIVRTHAHTDN